MSDMIDNSEFERCINASDLIDWIIETCPDWCEGAIRTIVDHIDEMPSAQPEIIRCKDCNKNYGSEHNPRCDYMDAHLWPDSFCSYGERREDE